uniref:Uncharacterized protein n=1 Tax=Timema shepardi TaxID=629360 RepID=A0A7R9AZD7_TIMSH|nr:unnamed protein product [Timema shepardi]
MVRPVVLLAAVAVVCVARGQKPTSGSKRRDVYIAGFFPYGRHIPESRVGRGVMPSVMLAVDHINENPTVLRNYMLHMYWNDTEANAGLAITLKGTTRIVHQSQ